MVEVSTPPTTLNVPAILTNANRTGMVNSNVANAGRDKTKFAHAPTPPPTRGVVCNKDQRDENRINVRNNQTLRPLPHKSS